MNRVKYGEFTWEELRERAKEGYLVILPTGCTEQHAGHLPVDTDTFQASTLAIEGASQAEKRAQTKVLVMPTIPYGPASEHHGFPGTISVRMEVYGQMVQDIIRSVAQAGFRRIAVLKGCGGHFIEGFMWDLKATLAEAGHDVTLRILQVDKDWRELQEKYFPGVPSGHAAAMETALALGKRSHLVKTEKAVRPEVRSMEDTYRKGGEVFFMGEVSNTGALGDPTPATEEIGATLWNELIDRFAEYLTWLEDYDRKLGRLG